MEPDLGHLVVVLLALIDGHGPDEQLLDQDDGVLGDHFFLPMVLVVLVQRSRSYHHQDRRVKPVFISGTIPSLIPLGVYGRKFSYNL